MRVLRDSVGAGGEPRLRAMSVDVSGHDPYVDYSRVGVVDVAPERTVVEQPGDPELANHVRVRHASALYTLVYEGSRQLVLAALADPGDTVEVELLESEIAYKAVGLGPTRCVAEPTGDGWDSLAAATRAGRRVAVETAAVASDEAGKTVVTLEARWAVGPPG